MCGTEDTSRPPPLAARPSACLPSVVPKGCKLSKPSQDGVYRFPRGFNLTGPPCDEGVLVIGDLRLPVALRAGPPTTLLVRSVKLGAPEYTRRISAMKPAGFEVRGEGGHRDEMIGIDSCLPACLNVGMHSSAGEVLNGWPRVVATHSVLLLCVMPCRRLIVCCCCLQPIKWSFLNIFARTNPSYGYGVAISQMQNFPPLLKYIRSQTSTSDWSIAGATQRQSPHGVWTSRSISDRCTYQLSWQRLRGELCRRSRWS